jgi:hypothetical protein
MKTIFALTLVTALTSVAQSQRIQSSYTDLSGSACRTLDVDKQTGASTQRCPGVSGYKLLVHDDDSRQSIAVVNPAGREHELNFWEVITPAFSSVGEKAEWRIARTNGKTLPIALIVRVNASEDPENPKRVTSYLAVSKITSGEVCVTHKIKASSTANDEARRAADSNSNAPCLKPADK